MAALESLDLLSIGVVVTNASCRLLLANQTAEQILAARDGLELTTGGVLSTTWGRSNPSLNEVIHDTNRAVELGMPDYKGRVLAVQRRSGKRPLTLLVRSATVASSPLDLAGPAALVFILDPEFSGQSAELELRQLFGLTSAEARLASLLMEGQTLEDCCDVLDICYSTARMHLGNLFAKTGVRRQGQLVSLLLRSLGVVRMRRRETKGSRGGGSPSHGKLTPATNASPSTEVRHIQLAALETLNLLNIGVVVTNGACQPLLANRHADQILATRDGLELTTHGVLSTMRECDTLALRKVMQQAANVAALGKSETKSRALPAWRPSGKRPLTLLVRSSTATPASPASLGPVALIFILDPEFSAQSTEIELGQLYGLTSSEARLANLLMEGKTFEDCCDLLDIRCSTGRMHLGNLFAKTGVQRQCQLISLLLKSLGLVRMRWAVESGG